MKFPLLIACCLSAPLVLAAEAEQRRAVFDYQMNCQGCHTPDGSGAVSVPGMKDHVGVFLDSQQGREYLVRVPGSATSALNDARLAAVLNWIITAFAGDSLREPFEPYTAVEVGRLRQQPLNEVDRYRARLLQDLASASAGN